MFPHAKKFLFAACLLMACATAETQAQSFSLPMPRDVGANPNTLAVGDFNGDGKLDVAVGNAQGNSVTIALGNGDGTFVSSIEYNTDINPEGVAAADFNKDGKLDVAVGNRNGGLLNTGNITVRFGNGDGTLQAPASYNADTPAGLYAVDLNKDGNLDLVTASNETSKATVLLGNADGTFNAAVGYAVGARPVDVAVADYNNDGKLDLATADIDNAGYSILLGNGDGTFQAAASTHVIGLLFRPISIAAGDLNGDGKQDLVCASPNGLFVGVLIGNGDGSFQQPVDYSATAGEPVNARLGDFNGDGKLDVAVANASNATPGSVGVLRGNGDGTLQAVASFPTQKGPWGVAVTDFNKDGKTDLITTNNSINRVNVLLNSPSARGESFNATIGAELTGVRVASFTDYNTTKTAASFTATINWGDGTVPTAGTITANGGGGFDVTGTHTYAAPGAYAVTVQIADTSGNFASASGTATVAKNNQTITFGALAGKTFGDADFSVSATASSGLTVSFAASGNCAVTGTTVHITGAGSCTITASQAGDASFNAAPDVPQSFQIAKAATTTAVSSSSNPSGAGQAITLFATVRSGAGTPTGSVQFKADGSNLGSPVALDPDGVAAFTTSSLNAGTHTITAEYGGDSNFASSAGTLSGGQSVAAGGVIEFKANFAVGERAGSVTVTATRSGSTSLPVDVDYATDDGSSPSVFVPCSAVTGIALDRCDFTKARGTLHFAAGESEKSFVVLVSDDTYVEGEERAELRLSNPTGGAALGPRAVTDLIIGDDSPESFGNPLDDNASFVRQHYHDFLNREPDADGIAFWTGQMANCGNPNLEVCRVNVSAAFFKSIEFQETGYLVYRTYKTAFGDATSPGVAGTVPVVRFDDFLSDTQRIGQGVQVGIGDWETRLAENKNAYALAFVQRPRFTAEYPSTLTPAQFVDKLNANTGGVLTQGERDTAVNTLSADNTTHGRSVILGVVAEKPLLRQRELNRAFVLMEYFGYLRRNPSDAPEATLNYAGWRFWLDKLEENGGNFVKAEMVKAFITSDEYRQRFAQ